MGATDDSRGDTTRWLTLSAVAVGLFMIMLDNTVVTVALPAMQRGLGVGVNELEWTVNAYTLAFGVLMLTAGRLADLVGRRRVFLAGLVCFSAASLACGLADSGLALIAARTVQGIGAAAMMPASLSIVSVTFDDEQRGLAIGIWTSVSAVALAIGPLLGGLIVEHLSWHWIFFINVPVGAAGVIAGRALIVESRDARARRRFDVAGLLISTGALIAIVLAMVRANELGWTSPAVLALLGGGLLGLAAFVVHERRASAPLLNLALFRNPAFAGANAIALLISLAMFGVLFYVSLYMQQVLGYSPLQAGAAFLPLTLLVSALAPLAGRVADRVGPRGLIVVGMGLTGLSLLALSRAGADSSYATLLPGLILGGIGIAITMTPMTTAALATVPAAEAGEGSGILTTFRQVGGCVGIALMGSILAAAGGGEAASAGAAHPGAFVDGMRAALLAGAGISFAGALVAAVTIRVRGREASGSAVETAGA